HMMNKKFFDRMRCSMPMRRPCLFLESILFVAFGSACVPMESIEPRSRPLLKPYRPFLKSFRPFLKSSQDVASLGVDEKEQHSRYVRTLRDDDIFSSRTGRWKVKPLKKLEEDTAAHMRVESPRLPPECVPSAPKLTLRSWMSSVGSHIVSKLEAVLTNTHSSECGARWFQLTASIPEGYNLMNPHARVRRVKLLPGTSGIFVFFVCNHGFSGDFVVDVRSSFPGDGQSVRARIRVEVDLLPPPSPLQFRGAFSKQGVSLHWKLLASSVLQKDLERFEIRRRVGKKVLVFHVSKTSLVFVDRSVPKDAEEVSYTLVAFDRVQNSSFPSHLVISRSVDAK
ncbi:MAG: hypothetical protein AAGJ35_13275, partial [Myxococcota bacterium]